MHDLWRNDEEIYDPGKFFAAETMKEVRGYIKNREKDKPFFLYWAVNIPHYPLQPSEKWLEYYSKLLILAECMLPLYLHLMIIWENCVGF